MGQSRRLYRLIDCSTQPMISNLLCTGPEDDLQSVESIFRHMDIIEWVVWGGIAVFLALSGLVLGQLNRSRSLRHANQVRRTEQWWTIINPLAGGSPVWGNRTPSIGLRLGLLYVGSFLLYVVNNPIPGALLILWAIILQISVWLEKRRRRQVNAEST